MKSNPSATRIANVTSAVTIAVNFLLSAFKFLAGILGQSSACFPTRCIPLPMC